MYLGGLSAHIMNFTSVNAWPRCVRKVLKWLSKAKNTWIPRALHERETGRIDVTEVLILISPQDLPGSLLIFGAHAEHLR